MSVVSEIPAISPEFAVEYFTRALALETDCFDVASAQKSNNVDFGTLAPCRGNFHHAAAQRRS
ncbi:hypothetical protein GOZ89_18315 [Agrobacterium vitis]|uniref:hypothetical protein n=1 Tax=Agrobacterium vitis TaxID=373 RepID=UPI0012E765F6|nr:hypothetical protein [Agrobacterium vitis]MCF1469267.1 hypothetical protein [Agrobacterium vitis]MVA81379.1 hypothetical protein [Agrobacterium vitis]